MLVPEYEVKLNKEKKAYLRKVSEISIEDSDLTVGNAKMVASIMQKYLNAGELFEERVYVFCLGTKKKLVGISLLSIGKQDCTLFGIKELFIRAILMRAAAVIIAHNHPSGAVIPSKRDIEITEKLRKGCELLEFELLDHVIVSDKDYFSFSEMGLL